jgi:hypothetical protein
MAKDADLALLSALSIQLSASFPVSGFKQITRNTQPGAHNIYDNERNP